MKKSFLFIILTLFSEWTLAQFSGDGFYRIKNYDTQRYLTVIDNRSSFSWQTNEPDLSAIQPIRSFERIVANPASIIYIDNVKGSEYTLRAQNVDTYELVGVYLKLSTRNNGKYYYAYATNSGVTKYLTDTRNEDQDEGVLRTGTAYRSWRIIPVDSSTDNYFGIIPEFESNGSYYSTMYASFACQPNQENLDVYYVSSLVNNVAILSEVKNNYVPLNTPVIIRCTSNNSSDNRMNVYVSGGTPVTGNLLKGVLFNNDKKEPCNRVAYNANTMRVLGLTKEGTIGFVTADIDYLPANKAYLTVPVGSPSEIRMMTKEEYETGIDDIKSTENDNHIYIDLSGRRVNNPSKGVYVSTNGKKICK